MGSEMTENLLVLSADVKRAPIGSPHLCILPAISRKLSCMAKDKPDAGLPALLTWPPMPESAVLSAKRIDVSGRQQIWFVIHSEFGFTLSYASKKRVGPVVEFRHRDANT